MCWESKTKPIPKIATEDFEIYKICLDGRVGHIEVRSFYNNFYYNLRQLYTQEKPLSINEINSPRKYQIERAFHSYLPSCELVGTNSGLYIVNGAHYCGYHLVKVKGYIPKGATYYVNNKNEVVSDKIVLTSYEYI